ncbi:MAG: zeta toxin family protein [Gracilibacteraceae bacterium]|jgi:predicted ABC-type ATPase|nr:zeta toxin family protein [Gracilibacteraceae bacterium]
MNSTDEPRILVFAGPNGSGKSTVSAAWRTVGLYVNADDIKAKRGCGDLAAAREAERLRELCLSRRDSFTFETVLSTDRNLDLLTRAKAATYHIESVFILTADPELNVLRVHSRVLAGGHSVAADKIRSRYAKSLAHIARLAALSDVFRLVDNTAKPEILFVKDETGAQLRPGRYWSAEAIGILLQSNP